MRFKYWRLPGASRRKGGVPVPLIEVGIPTTSYGIVRWSCLVDSGSDYCLFNAQLIGEEMLGLNVREGKKLKSGMRGLSGIPLETYLHPIGLKVGGWEYEIKFGFVYGFEADFGILGRRGFFDLFKKVCFSQDKQEVIVQFREG